MGRHNKLLIDLMQSKAKRVRELIDLPENLYFNEGDRDEIAGWGEEEAKNIWRDIKKNIHATAPSGLRREVCPFCHKAGLMIYKKPFCEKCGYSSRHGICHDKDASSDFARIIATFNDLGIVCGRFFNSDYYASLVEHLEKDASKQLSV